MSTNVPVQPREEWTVTSLGNELVSHGVGSDSAERLASRLIKDKYNSTSRLRHMNLARIPIYAEELSLNLQNTTAFVSYIHGFIAYVCVKIFLFVFFLGVRIGLTVDSVVAHAKRMATLKASQKQNDETSSVLVEQEQKLQRSISDIEGTSGIQAGEVLAKVRVLTNTYLLTQSRFLNKSGVLFFLLCFAGISCCSAALVAVSQSGIMKQNYNPARMSEIRGVMQETVFFLL